jgi:hypothetical protein
MPECYARPELQQHLTQLEGRLATRIDAAEAHMTERIEATETRLLTEFHKWASPMEARQRTHSAAMRAIDLEMEAREERVSKLEGKKPQ